jgi:protein phosphatase
MGPVRAFWLRFTRFPLSDGDVLLLCTDGLSEPVDEGRIADFLGNFEDPDVAAELLVGLALEAGGPDNVMPILARYLVGPNSC